MNKVIAIDFDGTLCGYAYPDIGEPNAAIINKAIDEQKKGARLILWTCREHEPLEEAVEWCKEHGIVFDAINANIPEWINAYNNDCRKVGATEYWDDRAKGLDTLVGMNTKPPTRFDLITASPVAFSRWLAAYSHSLRTNGKKGNHANQYPDPDTGTLAWLMHEALPGEV